MKETKAVRVRKRPAGGMQVEYQLDYSKSRPNRFAAKYAAGSGVVALDPDVAQVLTSPESVKQVLRALMETMPRKTSK